MTTLRICIFEYGCETHCGKALELHEKYKILLVVECFVLMPKMCDNYLIFYTCANSRIIRPLLLFSLIQFK